MALSAREKLVRHLENEGKLELWSGILAAQSTEDDHDENMKNRNAESAFSRKAVWGETSGGKGKQGADEMRQTILGDYTHTGTDLGKLAKWAAVALLGGGIPVAGYFIGDAIKNMKPDVVNNITEQGEDTDTVTEWDLP